MTDPSPESHSQNTSSWFLFSSEIIPGHSAILGDNYTAFYTIHYAAILLITLSVVSCVIVIWQIVVEFQGKNERTKVDFAFRFPLYLAVADLLWGISHFVDHMYLIVTEVYPETWAASTALSINIWFFLGYQQLMHASLAAYMYLRVVHLNTLDLGKWEWRLHLLCLSFMALTSIAFYFIGGFGCSGYWFLEDRASAGGKVLGFTIAIVCTFNAICTTFGYHLIQQKINDQKQKRNSTQNTKTYYSTATKCLTTYVRNAAALYIPFAILAWLHIIQSFFGVIEPITAFLVVVVANSSGWANAWGFFHNERLKKRRLDLFTSEVHPQTMSNVSNTDNTPVTSKEML